MEPYWNSMEDDTDVIMRRVKRREKIMREKKRRQRNRIIAVCVALLVLVLTVVLGKALIDRKKQNKESEVNQEQVEEQVSEEQETEEEPEVELEQAVTPKYEFTIPSDYQNIASETVISKNAILVDESTDTIVASRGAKEQIYPASMTKVLTVLVAAEHITEEQLSDTFTMTLEITDYAYSNDCSSVGFLDGEMIPVIDLFYGTILSSGGDAAVGLATYVAGSHEAFVELMNQKLEELGIAETTHFTNCVGLHDENHYSTAYDMAIIMKAALENELCKKVLGERVYMTTPTEQHPEGLTISNWFIRRIEDKDTGGVVLGAKTGYVVESGNCAVSWGEFGNKTPYICVTAGSSSNWRCIYDHVDIYTQYVPGAAVGKDTITE